MACAAVSTFEDVTEVTILLNACLVQCFVGSPLVK